MYEEQLVAVHRNNHGEIISFQTSSNRVISYRKAILEAEEGIITGVHIKEDREGNSLITPNDVSSFDHFPSIF
ncbi:regulatory protein YycI of two-component signal transduction system YycFG [Cytobacillus eiseniae]|uniref:Regulatory protein YycI of two-component signal transduction system YycFG n=1 Tax=Cytobacillus eiseniae TaxID=762947 RepID=A0ABS4RF01_9BACI|nr:DUF3892 domain-containing protein [Cytobacillus eiseniae]MBP2241279.1 regulatory protein YycI of two-component signal transduction system YycFG [Cytobacillus eiseniae]